MEPIISPWLIYVLGIIPTLKFILAILCFILPVISFLIFTQYDMEYDGDDKKFYKKLIKILLMAFIISVLSLIFIPSKDTVIAMMVSKNITVENLSQGKEIVKNSIDYIFEKIEQIK